MEENESDFKNVTAENICTHCAIYGMLITSGVIAIILNGVAFLAMFRMKTKNNTIRLLESLAIADISFASCQFISSILKGTYCACLGLEVSQTGKKTLGELTQILRISATPMLYAVLFTLLIMTIERLLATKKPFEFKALVTKQRVQLALGFSWLVAVVITIAQLLVERNNLYPYVNYNVFQVIQAVLSIIIFIFISSCYGVIYIRIRNRHIISGYITTALIILTFILLWLPCVTVYLIFFVYPEFANTSEGFDIFVGTYCLLSLNAISDPIIYTTRNRKVRKELNKLFALCGIQFRKKKNAQSSIEKSLFRPVTTESCL